MMECVNVAVVPHVAAQQGLATLALGRTAAPERGASVRSTGCGNRLRGGIGEIGDIGDGLQGSGFAQALTTAISMQLRM